jgi:hypothetical protein
MVLGIAAIRQFPALARWQVFPVIVLVLKLVVDYATHRVEHRPRPNEAGGRLTGPQPA